jgi:hypothetical protein
MTRIVITLAILAHGIGHVLFLANAWGYWKSDFGRTPLFTNVLHVSQGLENAIGLLWIIPLAAFIVAAWAYFGETAYWQPLALGAALISCFLIAAFWNSLNMSSAFFAFVFNAVLMLMVITQQAITAVEG